MSISYRIAFLAVLCASAPAVPAGAQWVINGVPVCTASDWQSNPELATDGAGGAIVVWQDRRGGAYDIYVQRVDSAGVALWTVDGVPICTAAGSQEYPVIVSDGAGGAIIAWMDGRSGSNTDIYSQRVDAGGSVLWTIDGVTICTNMYDQYYPKIVTDGVGGAVIAWEDQRIGAFIGVWAQRVNPNGTRRWMVDGVTVCHKDDLLLEDIQMIPDGSGGAILVWQEYDPMFFGSDIRAERINSFGGREWASYNTGHPICTAPGSQMSPEICSDGASGAVMIWADARNGGLDVYAQRVNASGGFHWASNGVPLCTEEGTQGDPHLCPDGTGGGIAVWYDGRVAETDIYAQRVDGSGSIEWAEEGLPICAYGGYQYAPRAVSDGAGGAVIAWQDSRFGISDVYAQHVSDEGNMEWSPDGAPVCDAPQEQQRVRSIYDPAGKVLMTWRDKRDGDVGDIYAQRIPFAPTVTDANDPSTLPTGRLGQNYPNPFNPATRIAFDLPGPAHVSLRIYDPAGRLVRVMVDEEMPAGRHETVWDGLDDGGRPAAAGVYFSRLVAGGFDESRKMILLR